MFECVRRDIERYAQRGDGSAQRSLAKKLYMLLSTPGLQAVLVFRFGAWIGRSVRVRVVRLPLKLVYAAANLLCIVVWGIDIDPEARIGPGLYIGHQSGVLIGPVTMGRDCNVAHQVTIGRRADGSGDVPIIGDRVWIGVGSVVFGGIRIGDGATIGPLTVVGRNLPPRALVIGNPLKVLRLNYDNTTEIYGRQGRPAAAGGGAPIGTENFVAPAIDMESRA